MAGLAYALDLSRKQLLVYKKRYQYGYAITKARRKIEMDVERRMNDKREFTPGLIFNLKNNFDWKDESKVENTIKGLKGFMQVNEDNKPI
jgi:hypothetical protein